MSEQEYAKVFAKNLRNIMYINRKTQADLSRDLRISKTTLSSWMNGNRLPRMSKVDLLCHYFNCSRYDLLENNGAPKQSIRLTQEEIDLIDSFKKLNARGKARVMENVRDLLRIDEYTSKGARSSTFTA